MQFWLTLMSVLLLFAATSSITGESVEGQGITKMGKATNHTNPNEQTELRVLPISEEKRQRMKKMEELADNTSTYEQLHLPDYTKSSLANIFLPTSTLFPLSTPFSLQDINSIVNVPLLRKTDQGFYTYFQYESGKLFIFFTKNGWADCMLCLPSTPLTMDHFDGIREGVTTLEDVLRLDDSMIASKFTPRLFAGGPWQKEKTLSTEHVFPNGDLLNIHFELRDDEYIVTRYSLGEKELQNYLSLILEIDQ